MGLAALIAALAAITFVVVFMWDGWTRPEYNPVRHPVSALALGDRGWVQTSNFVICGVAITVGGVAVGGVTWPLGAAIAVFGLALVVSGLFPMDAMRGYPPGTPDRTPATLSHRHRWHDRAGAVAFMCIPVMPAIAAFSTAFGWEVRGYSAVTAVAAMVLVSHFGSAWDKDDDCTGVWQRAALITALVWLAVLSTVVAL
ncbi:DUF998 domain-containing protein [Hoyosella altamirensis]|uniref:DUF998 domain-containing protein n=1 Tax=Hoyosella altamirensis TaxID=616997 RepID=A0A839RUQ5_9ACTN|nr:DUF998 domain-containing protein [Hoyosella altamirensis]MBB3039794.1 hypothetical protein [Hoyosella altamirensis]